MDLNLRLGQKKKQKKKYLPSLKWGVEKTDRHNNNVDDAADLKCNRRKTIPSNNLIVDTHACMCVRMCDDYNTNTAFTHTYTHISSQIESNKKISIIIIKVEVYDLSECS